MTPRAPTQPHTSPALPTPTDIWKQMSYTPPRGPCAHKVSIIAPACACLRFMIHPVKAATSFECDGCGHHASFHRMENRADDEVMKRWMAEGVGKEQKDRVEVRRDNMSFLAHLSTDELRLLEERLTDELRSLRRLSSKTALEDEVRILDARPVAQKRRRIQS